MLGEVQVYTLEVGGISPGQTREFIRDYDGAGEFNFVKAAFQPFQLPPGIIKDVMVEQDNTVTIRLTNVRSASVDIENPVEVAVVVTQT